MKLLGKTLLIILGIIVFLILLAILTALSWWLKWPLFTGAVIMLVLCAFFILYKSVRAFLRWQDKKKFVAQVALEQSAFNEQEASKTHTDILENWNLGIGHMLQGASSKKFNNLYPGFIMLDMNNEPSHLLDSFGNLVTTNSESSFTWHFLSSSVLAKFTVKKIPDDAWEEIFTLFRGNRTNLNLYGIILLLPYDSLRYASTEELKQYGQKMRSLSQQIIHIFEKDLPVYILIEGMQTIPGMSEVLREASSNITFKMFGADFNSEKPGAARELIDKLCLELHFIVLSGAAEGRPPEGDMVKAYCDFNQFGGILEAISEPVFRKTAYGTVPKSGGVYFCESPSARAEKGLFSEAFFTQTLSGALKPIDLKGFTLTFYEKAKVKLMAAWLILLFAFCSVISANTLYEYYVLSDNTFLKASKDDTDIGKNYALMNEIKRLQKARKVWPLPFFSFDAISIKELNLKEKFINQVLAESILPPILEDMKTNFSLDSDKLKKNSKLETNNYNLTKELTWLLSLFSDKIHRGHVSNTDQYTYPISETNEDRWSPVLGTVLSAAVEWTEDKEFLNNISNRLVRILTLRLTNSPKKLWNSLLESLNNNYKKKEIHLSTYWSHLASGSTDDYIIPAAYTEYGSNYLEDFLLDIKTISNNDDQVSIYIEEHAKQYLKDYEKIWNNFIKEFCSQVNGINQSKIYLDIADSNNVKTLPHLRFMNTLGKELLPLRKMETSPDWVNQFIVANIVLEIALSNATSAEDAPWKSIPNLILKSPDLLRKLRAETKDATQLRTFLERSNSLRLFFTDVKKITELYGSAEKSYELAAKHFEVGQKEALKADTDFTKMIDNIAKGADNKVLKQTAINISCWNSFIDFLAKGFTLQAANFLQNEWEKDVLANTAMMQSDVADKSFTEGGKVVNDFVEKKAKPFLATNGSTYIPARWEDIEFPFTQDFLKMLAQAKVFADHPTQDQYEILLRTQPTLVNTDSAELPDSTSLKLMCTGEDNELVNRNYPLEKRFNYKPSECGKTVLDINFPSFTIEKEYANFADFVEDFRLGERVFTPQEFEDSGKSMESAQVKEVHVRIIPDNTRDMLSSVKKQLPDVPTRITYTW